MGTADDHEVCMTRREKIVFFFPSLCFEGQNTMRLQLQREPNCVHGWHPWAINGHLEKLLLVVKSSCKSKAGESL